MVVFFKNNQLVYKDFDAEDLNDFVAQLSNEGISLDMIVSIQARHH